MFDFVRRFIEGRKRKKRVKKIERVLGGVDDDLIRRLSEL